MLFTDAVGNLAAEAGGIRLGGPPGGIRLGGPPGGIRPGDPGPLSYKTLSKNPSRQA